MPVYVYYCAHCHGRFQHLARRFDAPAPACPRCGNPEVERMVAAANLLRGEDHHQRQLREQRQQIDGEDLRSVARFLDNSGRLEDAEGVYGSRAYRELLKRRIDGARDADLEDLTADLVEQMQASEATQMAGAVLFDERVENRMQAEGPPDHSHEPEASTHGRRPAARPRRTADDLGWG